MEHLRLGARVCRKTQTPSPEHLLHAKTDTAWRSMDSLSVEFQRALEPILSLRVFIRG